MLTATTASASFPVLNVNASSTVTFNVTLLTQSTSTHSTLSTFSTTASPTTPWYLSAGKSSLRTFSRNVHINIVHVCRPKSIVLLFI